MESIFKLPRQRILAAAIGGFFAGFAVPALSIDMEDMIDKLHEKGVLSDEEYQEMRTDVRAEKRKEALEAALDREHKEKAKEAPKVSIGPGLKVDSADGQHSISLVGRLHFDFRDLPNDYVKSNDRDSAGLGDGYEVRRARIGVSGKMFKDIGFEVLTNAVGSGDLIDTGWVNFAHFKPVQVRLGKFKQPFSLEELTSSNNIDFMERSYANQLVPAKKLSVMLHGEPIDGVTYGVSHFQQDSRQVSEGDGMQTAMRATVNVSQLANIANTVLHFGLGRTDGHYQVRPAVSSQTNSGAQTATRATIVGFNSENRGLANVYRAQIGGSTPGANGAFAGASDEIAADVNKEMDGIEVALAYGPFKFQAETVKASFEATHPPAGQRVTGDVKADYFEFVWNITGEKWSEAYRSGVFSGIKPNNNFKPGSGLGAWQLGVRLSSYDASDITATGTSSREQNVDKGETLTIGVNWLINPNTRVMLNHAETKFKPSGSSPALAVSPLDISQGTVTAQDSETISSLRVQVSF